MNVGVRRGAWVAYGLLVAATARGKVLSFTHAEQQGTFLCWAAAAETAWSSLRGAGGPKSSCWILSHALAPTNCCLADGSVDNANCDQPTGFYDDVLPKALKAKRAAYGDPTQAVEPTLALLEREIGTYQRPVVAWWKLSASCEAAGHVVVALGIDLPTGPQPQVLISDPILHGAIQADWDYFRCGPVNAGHCAVYHRVGGGVFESGSKVQEFSGCSNPMMPAGTHAAPRAVSTAVTSAMRDDMLSALGMVGAAPITCDGPQVEVEFSGGDQGRARAGPDPTARTDVQQLLVTCQQGATPFLAAVAQTSNLRLLWFGATSFARVLSTEIPMVSGRGSLVLRVFPGSATAQLFRRDAEAAARWLVRPGQYLRRNTN